MVKTLIGNGSSRALLKIQNCLSKHSDDIGPPKLRCPVNMLVTVEKKSRLGAVDVIEESIKSLMHFSVQLVDTSR